MLTGANPGDLFVVIVAGTSVALVDVMHSGGPLWIAVGAKHR
jgi:hypothetical protein